LTVIRAEVDHRAVVVGDRLLDEESQIRRDDARATVAPFTRRRSA
jgi:hypothetical protein